MQLTKIDHWLREKFIYRTHIYAMRIPDGAIPNDVLIEELEDTPTRRYRYRFVANATADVDAVLHVLKQGNQMFATRIVEENPWYKSVIAPHGKSFLFRVVWTGIGLFGALVVMVAGAIAWSNDELRGELIDAFKLFLNG